MASRRKIAIVSLGVLAGFALFFKAGQLGLRQIPFFQIRQVELVGVRFLAPDALIRAMELPGEVNLFDDHSESQLKLKSVGGVVEVELKRKLPGTLRVMVVERVPVAFAPGPAGLIALDERARPLPYDAADGGLDLPIVANADTTLIGVVATVQLADPTLYEQAEWIEFNGNGVVRVVTEEHVILFTSEPTVGDVHAVQAVRQHVLATGETYNEFDARFGGWVVVRRTQA